METEPWLLEQQHNDSQDRRLRRPVCPDCGQTITSERCFPIEDGYLCLKCAAYRLVEVDSIS